MPRTCSLVALHPLTLPSPLQNPYDDREDEVGRSLLHSNPTGANPGPFDDHQQGGGLYAGGPDVRPQSTYSLTETYASDATTTRYAGQAHEGSDVYSATHGYDPQSEFGAPHRAPSPYARSETSSTEAWRQRQQPGGGAAGGGGGLKRGMTRKVKLVQGSVLSADYPVPSAIQNAIQAKYRNDLESGSEEFTHMRCEFQLFFSLSPIFCLTCAGAALTAARHGRHLRPQ